MAKEISGYVKLQVKGGQANPAPPVGPALGSKGVNIMEFCKQFNARTQDKMAKLSKKRKTAEAKVDKNKSYTLKDASTLVKEVNTAKFDASVDLHIRLGVDPKKADQQVRGTVSLPHGTGKTKKVLVLCTPDKEEAAKGAGADFVGLDEFVQKIEVGWTDVDVIIA